MWFRILSGSLLAAICLAEIKPCEYMDRIYRINGNSIDFPCESTKNIFITTERYKPCSIIPMRFQIDGDNERCFVVLTRLRSGNPVTLGVIDLTRPSCYAHIKPYPCWSYQEEGNCNAFQSVVDIFIDVKVSASANELHGNTWEINGVTVCAAAFCFVEVFGYLTVNMCAILKFDSNHMLDVLKFEFRYKPSNK